MNYFNLSCKQVFNYALLIFFLTAGLSVFNYESYSNDDKKKSEEYKPIKVELDYSKIQHTELFPIYNITLGKTTSEDLEAMGAVKSEKYNSYKYYGENFWIKDGVFDRMYLVRDAALPTKWREFGVNWKLSYDQWMELFKYHGFTIKIPGEPQLKYKKTSKEGDLPLFSATIVASRKSPVPISIKLSFKFREGLKDTNGTLYSMSIKRW